MVEKVFAVVVSYNGLRWIDKCLTSLKSSHLPVSIIVVDNASEDDTASYIKTNFPDTILIQAESNLGFGQANNKGIKYALGHGADYLFLLNQDAHVEEDTIGKLIETIKDHNEYGILSPLHLNGNGDKLDGGFANYAGPEYTDGLLSDLSLSKVSDVYESRFVNAAAWLVSKKCLETVGGFDPIFFHYGEDYNYCQRVHYHDLKVGIVPAVKIYHDREYKQQAYESEQIFRHYLITVADINNDHYLRDKKKLYRQDKIRMISSLLRRDLKRFRQNRNNIKLKRKFFPEVLESRKKNIKGGPVYIS